MYCYSIKDEKAESFSSPFFARSEREAIRSLIMVMRDGKSTLAQFTVDYSLWFVGSFDESTGCFYSDLRHVLNLVSLKEAPDVEK